MRDWNESLRTLDTLLAKHRKNLDQIYMFYLDVVTSILKNEITSEQVIKKVMDSLLEFGEFGGTRFFRLYRKLCFHVYYCYPQLRNDIDFFELAEIQRAELSMKDNNCE